MALRREWIGSVAGTGEPGAEQAGPYAALKSLAGSVRRDQESLEENAPGLSALQPIRVLFFVDQGKWDDWGASRAFAVLAAAVAERAPVIVAYSGRELEPGVLAEDWFAGVDRVDYAYGSGPESLSVAAVNRLRCVLDQLHITVVHCHTYNQVIAATLASLLSRRRRAVILTDHNSLGWEGVGQVKRFLCLMATRPHMITLTDRGGVVKRCACAFSRSITYIPNGVDTTLFDCAKRKPRNGTVRVLYPARLAPLKGHKDLLMATRKLLDRGCDIELRLAGDGELRPELEQFASQEGLNGRVKFLGWLTARQIASEMVQADIGVYPSYSEMMPCAVLEMMASAMPVVASRVGGIADAIRDRESGYLVNIGDIDALAERLYSLVQNPEIAEQVGRAAAARVAMNYSMSHVAEQVTALYERVGHGI